MRKEEAIKAFKQGVKADSENFSHQYLSVIIKLANLSGIEFVKEKSDSSVSFIIGTTEYYVPISLGADTENERRKVIADLDYYRGFLESVMKKLNNKHFVENAPQSILELEKKKKSDTEQKIRSLEELLKSF